MSVTGIDQITYCAGDLPTCRRFFEDWGLKLLQASDSLLEFECINGCKVLIESLAGCAHHTPLEEGSTLREVVWGVEREGDLDDYAASLAAQPDFVDQIVHGHRRVGCTDPNGLAIALQVSRKCSVSVECAEMNTWNSRPRVNRSAPIYEAATPIEVGHVVFFVSDVAGTSTFYRDRLGFVQSDSYPERGAFLRCSADGGHHDLFLLQLPSAKRGLNHVAFTVRDIHEVFGGGLNFSRLGWTTQLGPGRHPVSSAYFWYFKCPAGGLVEYYADEDQLTAEWVPREFDPSTTAFAEWAIEGGLDGHTRRQRNVGAAPGKFLTEKK